MSNDFFNHTNRLAQNTLARSNAVNSIFDAIVTGFAKLPSYARLRGGASNFATDAGTAGNFVLTLGGVDALFTGLTVRWKAAAANTGVCTVNLDGLGVKDYVAADGSAFSAGTIAAGMICEATYDGTRFRDTNSDSVAARAAAAASAAAAAASAGAASSSAGAASSSAASALASKNHFDSLWRGEQTSAPVDPVIGTMYLNTTDVPNVVYVYTEDGWNPVVTVSIGGLRRQDYTSVTGTGPFTVDGGFDAGDVYKNGTLLTQGTDWTASSGTFTLAVAAIVSDVISFRGYLANDAVDIYTKAEADARFLNKTDTAAARSVLSVSSTAEMNAAILAATPVGKIDWFALSAAPAGYLKANGAAVLISSYSALATAIYCGNANNASAEWGYKCTNPANPTGTRSTSGTYIVLPDARGRFPRALDDGAGIDSGRTLWSYQADQNLAHTHSGTTDSNGAHQHDIWAADGNVDGTGDKRLNNLLDNSTGADDSGKTSTDGAHTHTFTTGSSGGGEARPKNFVTLVCIKYQ